MPDHEKVLGFSTTIHFLKTYALVFHFYVVKEFHELSQYKESSKKVSKLKLGPRKSRPTNFNDFHYIKKFDF